MLLILCAWLVSGGTPRSGGVGLEGLRHPTLLLELAWPGLYAEPVDHPRAAALFRPQDVVKPPKPNLPIRALVLPDIGDESVRRIRYLGVLGPLLLLVCAGDMRRRVLPVVALLGSLAAAALMMKAATDRARASLAVTGMLCMLGTFGLLLMGRDRKRPLPAGLLLVVGSLSVAIAAVCIGLSMKAGAITDRALLAPFLDRLAARSAVAGASVPAPPSPEVLAQNAAHLRAVLDHAALATFASMTALLLHLKSRNALTFWLVALVWAADMVTASWLG
ncbi:MAG TPA: hypothetical protein VK824_07170 [Planctomycetota bacterium]|nr:hypothetical protein [Planctomycetota bacterium]